jgi:ribosomal protein L7/L12
VFRRPPPLPFLPGSSPKSEADDSLGDENFRNRVKEIIREEGTIQAIKYYRKVKGKGLMESKIFVETIRDAKD